MEFTELELFLLEMALDEVTWRMSIDSPNYQRFDLLSQKVTAIRLAQKHSDGSNGLGASIETGID